MKISQVKYELGRCSSSLSEKNLISTYLIRVKSLSKFNLKKAKISRGAKNMKTSGAS
jgi:hypothetical protein